MAAITGVLRRPTSYAGLWSWVTTVDHKRIGILYGVTAFAWFLVGGAEAMLIRTQLARSNNTFVTPDLYNQLFTMHGLTMVFLVIMPLSVAFFNIVVPLQIGARDVAFPRLNALSYWIFLLGSLLLNAGWLTASAPAVGWFAYANLTTEPYSPGNGVSFFTLGLLVLGTSSVAGALNFIITIVNLRAPGMGMMRIPVFTWMTFVTSFLLITAMPVIAIGVIELTFDRLFATNFFNTAKGGDPLLWQHLFWLFGHPEVYILILPAMGIVSEVLPTFSRKPLFGYPVVVYSGIVIGIMSWGVWSHHMFTVGLGPVANSVFAITTMLIAVPTGIKIFNWLATMWGGSIDFKAAMLFAVGFIAMFIIGGLSGVTHASVPSDYQQQDTYYIVAHFHYVLFGGSILGLFAGIYYWFPKATGRLLHEGLGKLHFWLTFIGFNMTFGPMHWLGLDGMPRRVYTYPTEMGWDFWNLVSTIGAYLIAVSVIVFLVNFFRSLSAGERASGDPWDGRTLEWAIPSPPPIYNFREIPRVHGRDAFWEQKHGQVSHGDPVHPPTVAGGSYGHEAEEGHHGIHVPSPSYFPVIVAVGLALAGAGLLISMAVSIVGVLVLIFGVYGWCFEPVSE